MELATRRLRLRPFTAANAADHLRLMEKLGMRQEADRDVFGFHAVCYGVSREAFLGRPSSP